jgi:hypothetical protein
VTGIPGNDYTRVIREDPVRKDILYAGTETGVYLSFDEGRQWQSLKLNLLSHPSMTCKYKNASTTL